MVSLLFRHIVRNYTYLHVESHSMLELTTESINSLFIRD